MQKLHSYNIFNTNHITSGKRNQNKQCSLIKQDSYAASAERDKISRYTDIERKNKVERTSRMRSGNQMCGNFSNRIANNCACVCGRKRPILGAGINMYLYLAILIGTSEDDECRSSTALPSRMENTVRGLTTFGMPCRLRPLGVSAEAVLANRNYYCLSVQH